MSVKQRTDSEGEPLKHLDIMAGKLDTKPDEMCRVAKLAKKGAE